jgi:glycosyltransferase involved in cell wall biosynthesis
VIFEALGAGLPFFSLNSGNIAEIARKTNAGICAENFIKLSMSIIRIINNTRRLKEMSKNGILNCKRIYNWKNIVKKYENLF